MNSTCSYQVACEVQVHGGEQTHPADTHAPAADGSVEEKQGEPEIEEEKKKDFPPGIPATGEDLPPGAHPEAAPSAEPEITAPVHGTVTTEAVLTEQQQHASPSGAQQLSLDCTSVSTGFFAYVRELGDSSCILESIEPIGTSSHIARLRKL
jgi:hypothetical protein